MLRSCTILFHLLTCLLIGHHVSAQQAEPRVITTGGGQSQAIAGYTVEFTVGETVIATAGTSPVFTQGFLQPLSALDFPEITLSLRATVKGSFVQLDWTTATETNNDWFFIERSADDIIFTSIDSVRTRAVNGNSASPIDYRYTDLQPLNGTGYYRLRVVSKNGLISYSETVQVTFAGEAWRVGIYPNPVKNTLYIKLFTDKKTPARVFITSVTGQVLLRQYIELPQGYSTHTLQLGSLARGMYVLSIRELFTNRRLNVKLIKE